MRPSKPKSSLVVKLEAEKSTFIKLFSLFSSDEELNDFKVNLLKKDTEKLRNQVTQLYKVLLETQYGTRKNHMFTVLEDIINSL